MLRIVARESRAAVSGTVRRHGGPAHVMCDGLGANVNADVAWLSSILGRDFMSYFFLY